MLLRAAAILAEPLQRQQNASLSNPHSSLGTKKKGGGVQGARLGEEGGGGKTTTILFFSQTGGVLPTLQRFDENRWRPLTPFPLKIFDHVSSSGSGADIAPSVHCGSTMKEAKASNLYEYFKSIFF